MPNPIPCDVQERNYERKLKAARETFEQSLKALPRKQRDKIYDMIAGAQRVSKEWRQRHLRQGRMP